MRHLRIHRPEEAARRELWDLAFNEEVGPAATYDVRDALQFSAYLSAREIFARTGLALPYRRKAA